jgi:hypothetical protein
VALAAVILIASGCRPDSADAGLNVWTTNGPAGPMVGTLAFDPITPTPLYAIAATGGFTAALFRSTDGGPTWRMLHDDARHVMLDPLVPTTLYVLGGGGCGVSKSTTSCPDGGRRRPGACERIALAAPHLSRRGSLCRSEEVPHPPRGGGRSA